MTKLTQCVIIKQLEEGKIAIKNHKTGLYEAEVFIKWSGKLLKATGKTKEEANFILRFIKQEYLKSPLEAANTKIHSPGFMVKKTEEGKHERKYSKGRAFFTCRRKGFNDENSDK